MQNQWTIGKKIGFGFATVILVLAIMGVITLLSISSINTTSNLFYKGAETLEDMNQSAVERRNFLINGMQADDRGETAVDRWQAAYEKMAEGLKELQGNSLLDADMRSAITDAVRGLDDYYAAFQSGVDAYQGREDAFQVWGDVGRAMTVMFQKTTDEIINPGWQNALATNDAGQMKQWAEINVSLSQNVIQPFLLLRVNGIYMVATRTDAQWNSFKAQLETTLEGINTWGGVVSGNAELERVLANFKEQMEIYAKAGDDFYDAVLKDRAADKDMASSAALIVNTVNSLQQSLTDDMSAVITRANFSSWLVTFIGIVIGVVLAVLITVGITRALKRVIEGLAAGSEQTSSASEQVSGASQSLAQGASEQASSLEETSASLEEMASMTRQNADNANQADTLMSETRKAVDESMKAMERMTSEIGNIRESANQTAKIIKTIDEIAFQTNLLALNAAVEAARAGEAGKGFAVVAEEVRNLAQRSAEAARNTADLIEGSQKNAESGVTVTEELAKSMQATAENSGKVASLVAEIAAASKEQAQGIDQVNTAVAEMDKVVQQNAANAEESASASEELSSQAQGLNAMVLELTAMVSKNSIHGSVANKAPRRLKTFAAKQPERLAEAAPLKTKKQEKKAVKPEEMIPLDDQDFKDF